MAQHSWNELLMFHIDLTSFMKLQHAQETMSKHLFYWEREELITCDGLIINHVTPQYYSNSTQQSWCSHFPALKILAQPTGNYGSEIDSIRNIHTQFDWQMSNWSKSQGKAKIGPLEWLLIFQKMNNWMILFYFFKLLVLKFQFATVTIPPFIVIVHVCLSHTNGGALMN